MLSEIKSGSGRQSGGRKSGGRKSGGRKSGGAPVIPIEARGGIMSQKFEQMQANPFFNPYYGQGRLIGGKMDGSTGYDGVLDYSARKSMYGGLSPATYYPYHPNADVGLTSFGRGRESGGFAFAPLIAALAPTLLPMVTGMVGKLLGQGALTGGALMGGRERGNAKNFSGGRSRGSVNDFSGGEMAGESADYVSVGQGRKSGGRLTGGRSRGNVADISGGKRKATAAQLKAAKSNPWLAHVKKVYAANPNMKYKDVLKKAKQSY